MTRNRTNGIRPLDGAVEVPARDQLLEDFARDRLATGTATTGLIPAEPSGDVDQRTAADLVAAAAEWASRAAVPGIGPSERLARAGQAADAFRDLAETAALLDPYATRGHSRIRDLMLAARVRGIRGDRQQALTRLDLDRQAQALRRAYADLGGVQTYAPSTAPSIAPSPARWLNSPYVVPATGGLDRGRLIASGWSTVPAAHLDPAPGDDVSATVQSLLDGDEVPWHLAALALNVSRQRLDWAQDDGAETEQLMTASVETALETAMLADLVNGAAAAASFTAAEAAVGATGYAADLVIANPADVGTVRRAYAAELSDASTWPTMLATIGAPAGTAVVMASPLVRAEASALDWLVADEPGVLGKSLAALRYGLAAPRVAAAVATVPVGA